MSKAIVITIRKPSFSRVKSWLSKVKENSPVRIVVRDAQAEEEAFIHRKDEDDAV